MPPPLPHDLRHNPLARSLASAPETRAFPFQDPRWRRVLETAARLLDTPRHFGLHPGGVVVSPGRIDDHVPCQRSAKGPVVTQLDKDAVQAVGLVKMDLLGNRALTVISDCLQLLRARGIEVDLEGLREDDARTGHLLREGRTLGCFQVESPGMRNLLKQTGASTMDDVIQAVALIRPGPAGSGMKDAYVRRFRGLEDPRPPHPRLTDVLWDTHGVMLYQEDVMQAASLVAGLDLAEADMLRRALQKRRGADIEALCRRFLQGAAEVGVTEEDARHVWDLIANFASFAFCKAHAVTYGRIAYRAVWLKAHHPAPYLTAFLCSDTGYYPARVYVEEARRLGVPILPPAVNVSGERFEVEWIDAEPTLRVGLGGVRNLSQATLERLIETRAEDGPFLSLPDFLERTGAHADEARSLVQCGAFDAFDRTRPELLMRLHLLRTPPRRAPDPTRTPAGSAFEELDRVQLEALTERNPGATPGGSAREALRAARSRALLDPSREDTGTPGWSGRGLGVAGAQLEPGESATLFPEPPGCAPVLPGLPDLDAHSRGRLEYDVLGFAVHEHPTRLFPCPADERIARRFGRAAGPVHGRFRSNSQTEQGIRPVNPIPCARLDQHRAGRVTLRGWPSASRRVRTEQGRLMRFLTLEDESGLAEVVLFPDVYERDGGRLVELGTLCVTGVVEDQMGACTLHAEKIW